MNDLVIESRVVYPASVPSAAVCAADLRNKLRATMSGWDNDFLELLKDWYRAEA